MGESAEAMWPLMIASVEAGVDLCDILEVFKLQCYGLVM